MNKKEITLDSGLIGLPNLKKWTLLKSETDLPIMWLQSLDDKGFRIPVSDPGLFCMSYKPVIPANAQKHFINDEDIVVMIVTTIPTSGGVITGNLTAPLLVSASGMTGIQIIQENRSYSMRQPLDINLWDNTQYKANDKIMVAESECSGNDNKVVVCV
jgi:flagellar assembly factor FliW